MYQVNNINKQQHWFSDETEKSFFYFHDFFRKLCECVCGVWVQTWNLWWGKTISDESWLLKKGLHHSSVCVLFFFSTVANETGESSSRPLARFAREYVQSDTWLKAVDFTFTLKLFSAQWGNRYECDTVRFIVSIITRVCNHNSSERC